MISNVLNAAMLVSVLFLMGFVAGESQAIIAEQQAVEEAALVQ